MTGEQRTVSLILLVVSLLLVMGVLFWLITRAGVARGDEHLALAVNLAYTGVVLPPWWAWRRRCTQSWTVRIGPEALVLGPSPPDGLSSGTSSTTAERTVIPYTDLRELRVINNTTYRSLKVRTHQGDRISLWPQVGWPSDDEARFLADESALTTWMRRQGFVCRRTVHKNQVRLVCTPRRERRQAAGRTRSRWVWTSIG